MLINKHNTQSIWTEDNSEGVYIIDQRQLPHKIEVERLSSFQDVFVAIRDMHLRGAPLIGVAAAYGIYLATTTAKDIVHLREKARHLKTARPTAVNLNWAVDRMMIKIESITNDLWQSASKVEADKIRTESILECKRIGEFGLKIVQQLHQKNPDRPVNILTHCNAGWLACVDYGTATAPIYKAHDIGIPVHVWVDETRPRNQGARITAFELTQHGIPNTLIVDNTGGHLMQTDQVDLVLVGSDRTAANGDVANKIGTYLKALAAKDNEVPFYVALPSSTFDLNLKDGNDIPIEQRSSDEVKYIQGELNGNIEKVLLSSKDTSSINYGFDITPARLVTGLITELGICAANENAISDILNK